MTPYNHNITLDMSGRDESTRLVTKQGDREARQVVCSLKAHNLPYYPVDGVRAEIAWQKPDGKQVLNNATIQDNTVTFTLTEQMLAVSGEGKAEVILLDNTGTISTSVFRFFVYPSAYDPAEIESSAEYGAFLEALQQVEAAEELCVIAAQKAESAAATANAQAEEASNAAEAANEAAEAAIEAATGFSVIYDPTTGKQDTIQNVVINLFQWMLTQTGEPITAGEFDALNLTAGVFDGKQISAIDFDTKANQLLGG